MRDADFREVSFTGTDIERCDLSGASLHGARFARSSLRDCAFQNLQGVEGLRGAALPWSDLVGLAGTFADALGIRVLDDADER